MSAASEARTMAAFASICAQARDGEQLLEAISGELRRVVPFDAAGWFALDPSTLLVTRPVRVENIDPGYRLAYWERESRVKDVLRFRELSRAAVPAGALLQATGNRPQLSPRYREYLVPQSYGDELRAVFRVGGRTWAVVDLYRAAARPAFSPAEVQVLTRLGPLLARTLRDLTVLSPPAARFPDDDGAVGTALFTRSGRPLSFDDQAGRWLGEIGGPQWSERPPEMSSMDAVVARAVNVRSGHDWGAASVRLRTASGWLTVSASVLTGLDGGEESVAVRIAPARGAEITPLLAEALGLTAREQECAQGVARGLTNREIAATLGISPYTVRDHLKAVFSKVGVTSRGELTARLF